MRTAILFMFIGNIETDAEQAWFIRTASDAHPYHMLSEEPKSPERRFRVLIFMPTSTVYFLVRYVR